TEKEKQSLGRGNLPVTANPIAGAEPGVPGCLDLGSIERLNSQAIRYQKTAQYFKAERLFHKALALCEQYRKADQPVILVTTLNHVARLYYDLGKYAEMEPLLLRALTIGEKALGTDDLEVAVTLDNLANFYFAQGRYANVQPVLLRALRIREKK